jgi:hypothetical protein
MGGLWVESNTRKRYQVSWFAHSDTKWLLEILTDVPFLPICTTVFQLDLSPLQAIETDWLNFNDEARLWQSPQTIITCVQALCTAFMTTPNAFALLEAERQRQGLHFLNLSGFEAEEMMDGFLHDELLAMAEAAKSAQQDGAKLLKLCGS